MNVLFVTSYFGRDPLLSYRKCVITAINLALFLPRIDGLLLKRAVTRNKYIYYGLFLILVGEIVFVCARTKSKNYFKNLRWQ